MHHLYPSNRHGLIFDTVSSLLSLLRVGDRDAYRQFFLDGMLAVEGMVNFVLAFPDCPISLNYNGVCTKYSSSITNCSLYNIFLVISCFCPPLMWETFIRLPLILLKDRFSKPSLNGYCLFN